MIYIYNSLERKKEEFVPLSPPNVNIYTCGVTVYDQSHIGHARSLYIFDVIRRYLKYRGFKVNFVRNITDIDDKIIKRANELKTDWKELVDKYIKSYHEDLDSLGILRGDFEPRATENIPEMIKYIEALIEKGHAYEAGGDVYFNVRSFPDYGKLSGQNIEEMETGARIDPSEHKKDPLDFALWKRSKENEPFWESPWGKGRPGWHIECSVMSQKFLKTDTLDIHAGGRDLIFPHHENEIAQAEALTEKPFAKYWMHGGLLTINGQKMAKSSGNFITIKDFMDKYKNADFLKLFFLSAHYSSPMDYTDEKISEAKQALERISILFGKIESQKSEIRSRKSEKIPQIEKVKDDFVKAMDDDFNTPQALASIFELVNLTNKNINDPYFVSHARSLLKDLSGLLGLKLDFTAQGLEDDADAIKVLIDKRIALKKEKKFSEADQIRKDLEAKGVILEDTKNGTTWRRKL
ncbi:MAG: cysteine--tRNA ligase [Candidatus Omnitrophica bacterium]|jgi:cysteinyl-tRNA synthetase|nr:cysteine--tRNA ligase [Candidatus Omnitrophota bacterium]